MGTDGTIQIGNVTFNSADIVEYKATNMRGLVVGQDGKMKGMTVFDIKLRTGQTLSLDNGKQSEKARVYIDDNNSLNINNANLIELKGSEEADNISVFKSKIQKVDISGDPQNVDRFCSMGSYYGEFNHDENDLLMFTGCAEPNESDFPLCK